LPISTWIPTLVALLLAILGGVYFSLFSCGGYVWHRHVFFGALGAAVLVAMFIPIFPNKPVLGRLAGALGVSVAFVLSQAIAAPFYPAPPESWSKFISLFLYALERGPC